MRKNDHFEEADQSVRSPGHEESDHAAEGDLKNSNKCVRLKRGCLKSKNVQSKKHLNYVMYHE